MHCLVRYYLLGNKAYVTYVWNLLYKKAREHPEHLKVVLSFLTDFSPSTSTGMISS